MARDFRGGVRKKGVPARVLRARECDTSAKRDSVIPLNFQNPFAAFRTAVAFLQYQHTVAVWNAGPAYCRSVFAVPACCSSTECSSSSMAATHEQRTVEAYAAAACSSLIIQ
eukprot:2458751-Rhodomonas_salina.1